MPQIRRAPFRVSLCPSLEMRYSISVSAAPKEKYTCGYLNRARYYFYSPALRKQIGKESLLIMNTLAAFPLGIYDFWLELRIQKMIDGGKLIVTEAPDGFQLHRVLQKAGKG